MALIFFDDFEYAVSRSDANADDIFTGTGGWSVCKTEQAGEPAANIYFYTATAIPGSGAPFPGGGTRVLVMECVGGTDGGQSDAYLQYGVSTPDTIPANVWFQYWIYIQNDAGQGRESLWHNQNKWFYLTNDTYPSHSHLWMMSHSSGVYSNQSTQPGGNWPNGDPSVTPNMFLSSSAGTSTIQYSGPGSEPEADDALGPQTLAEGLGVNRWTLVKLNVDTSTATPRYRCWMRAQNTSTFTLICDWQHGVNGLSWTYPTPGGHVAFRWPSTLGPVPPGTAYDSWTYIDDFAMADAEADLPTYSEAVSVSHRVFAPMRGVVR